MSMPRDQLLQQAVRGHGARDAAAAAGVDPGRVDAWLAGEARLQLFEMNALGRAVKFPIGPDDDLLAKFEAARPAGQGV